MTDQLLDDDMTQVSRAFLSHASEDKERFVLPFATMLRARGIDVWVDRWEMLPGDSLIRKIFDEGLENASAVIVVVSRYSLDKPWVREELDAAAVKRINTGSRLIPIVLDGLEPNQVPASIRHLLFESVTDLEQLDTTVDRVIRSIHGVTDRPPLGAPPAYTQSPTARIIGLDRVDSLILKALGDEALRDCGTRFTTEEFLRTATAELGITDEQAVESLQVLESHRQVELHTTIDGGFRHFDLTADGLETYCRAYLTAYPTIEQTVIARLAGWPSSQGNLRDLITAVDANPLLVEHIVDLLAAGRLVTVSKAIGGPNRVRFHNISPQLRRLARQ